MQTTLIMTKDPNSWLLLLYYDSLVKRLIHDKRVTTGILDKLVTNIIIG